MNKELRIAFKVIAAIADALKDGKVTRDEAYKIAELIIKEIIDLFSPQEKISGDKK
jgi:hypothetical protein